MNPLGKIICMFAGHKRGKPLRPIDPPHVPGDQNVRRFACPRCGHLTIYKIKPKSADVLQIPVSRT